MRRKGIVLLLVLALTLWAFPTLVLADGSSGTVGETEASITLPPETHLAEPLPDQGAAELNMNEGSNSNGGTAEASASAASSDETGDSEGDVQADALPSEGPNTAGGSAQVDNGGGSETTIAEYDTSAQANVPNPDGSPTALATENVYGVVITAPDGLLLGTGIPLEDLVEMERSSGRSEIKEECPYTPEESILAETKHEMWDVSLFDGTILFDRGYATAATHLELDGDFWAYVRAKIYGLEVWDPTPGEGYQGFGNLEDDTMDLAATLAEINAILALSNLEILNFLEATKNVTGDGADAEALLMRVVLYDNLTGDPLIVLALADVWSHFDNDGASTGGDEVDISTPPKEEEEPKPTTPPTEPTVTPPPTEPTVTPTAAPHPVIQPAPVVEAPVAQPAPAPAAQPQAQPTPSRGEQRQLPVTGFNFSWLLLGVGLILTGLRLRRI